MIDTLTRRDPVGWYFSFANHTGFLGAVVVPGIEYAACYLALIQDGLNPGGEVKAWPLANIPFECPLMQLMDKVECQRYEFIPLNGIENDSQY